MHCFLCQEVQRSTAWLCSLHFDFSDRWGPRRFWSIGGQQEKKHGNSGWWYIQLYIPYHPYPLVQKNISHIPGWFGIPQASQFTQELGISPRHCMKKYESEETPKVIVVVNAAPPPVVFTPVNLIASPLATSICQGEQRGSPFLDDLEWGIPAFCLGDGVLLGCDAL